MKHFLLTFLVSVAFALPACGGKTANSLVEDSQTHWLKACSGDSACGDLSCVCGRCIEECSEANSCSAPNRECFSARSKASATLCGEAKPAAVCLAECDRDKDCPSGQSCEGGACLPEANGGASYDPCAGKACGESCRLCAPDDDDCAESTEPKACTAEGQCGEPTSECPAGEERCSALNEAECAEADGCRAINGRTPGQAELFFIECVERDDQPCGNAETCAMKAGNLPVLFPTTCLPPEFAELNGEECHPESCDDRPIDDCESELCGVVSAWDTLGKSVEVGCMAKTRSCPPAITCGKPEAGGNALSFGNCLPKGWVRVDDEEECRGPDDLCILQPPEDCDAAMCVVSRGQNLMGEIEAAGCLSNMATCLDDSFCGIPDDPDAGPLFFSSSCMPEGWRSVDYAVCGEGEPDADCGDVPVADCRGACSPIRGVEQPGAQATPLGCLSADSTCGAAFTCASKAATDDPVRFSNTCIPKGWEERPFEDCAHLE